MTMKFCIRVDHQNVGSDIKKDFHKTSDVIDNDVIILRPLSIVQIYLNKKKHENTKQNSEIYTVVIDNDIILLKSGRFRQRTLSFERLYLTSFRMKQGRIGRVIKVPVDSITKIRIDQLVFFKKSYFRTPLTLSRCHGIIS